VPNLGLKRASTLYQRLHIHSLDELRQAVKGHRIRKLRGFGAKMEEKILQALWSTWERGGRGVPGPARVWPRLAGGG
jgi:DNA polymerase (family X)